MSLNVIGTVALSLAAHCLPGVVGEPEDFQRITNRRQRVAEFMRQRREELVLPPVGLAESRVGPRQFLRALFHLSLQFSRGPVLHDCEPERTVEQRRCQPGLFQVVVGPGV